MSNFAGYVYNDKEITVEYQNSIIATELIKVIKDYNRSCTSEAACLGYIRVSSEKDLEHDCSIQQQLINLVEFAKSKNLRIHDVLIHNGVSGGPFKKNGHSVHLKKYGTLNHVFFDLKYAFSKSDSDGQL